MLSAVSWRRSQYLETAVFILSSTFFAVFHVNFGIKSVNFAIPVFGCAFLVESVWVMERCALPNPWQYHAALCIVAGHMLAGNNSDITAIKYILAG